MGITKSTDEMARDSSGRSWSSTFGIVSAVSDLAVTVKRSIGELRIAKYSRGKRRMGEEAVLRISPCLRCKCPRVGYSVGTKKKSFWRLRAIRKKQVDHDITGKGRGVVRVNQINRS